jgi:hypothetical protein
MDQLNAMSRANFASASREVASEKQDLNSSLMNAIKDLKEEIQAVKKPRQMDQQSSLETAQDIRQELHETFQQAKQNRVMSEAENQIRSNLSEQHQSEADLAEFASTAFAGILNEEDIKKKKKGDKTSFEDKLERFEQMEALFSNYEPATPEQKETFEEFFNNMARIRNLKSKFKRLLNLEEKSAENPDPNSPAGG